MRKIFCVLFAFIMVGGLLAIPTIKEIKTHDYDYVSRVVIVFSGPVIYQANSSGPDQPLTIKIRQGQKSHDYVNPEISDSKMIQSITVEDNKGGTEIGLTFKYPYRFETMNLHADGFRIVLDVFRTDVPQTYEAQLAMSNFYFSTHAYQKALDILGFIAKAYPDKKQIKYYVAKNQAGLKQYDTAIANFEKVTSETREYQYAQAFLNELKGLKNYADFPDSLLDSDFDLALTSPGEKTEQEDMVPASTTEHKTGHSFVHVFVNAQIPLWLAVILMLLLIFINAVMLDFYHRRLKEAMTSIIRHERSSVPQIFADDESKRQTIARLLHDGWSNREIARELRIPESEVEHIAKQLSVSNI